MQVFMIQLDARLERDGFRTGHAKAAALGVDPGTWSRARRRQVRFSPQIVQAGLDRYPELAYYLSSGPHQMAGAA